MIIETLEISWAIPLTLIIWLLTCKMLPKFWSNTKMKWLFLVLAPFFFHICTAFIDIFFIGAVLNFECSGIDGAKYDCNISDRIEIQVLEFLVMAVTYITFWCPFLILVAVSSVLYNKLKKRSA